MFYAKINFAKTRHALMQRKLITNATYIMQVISGKLWNLTETEHMMISSKRRKTCITKRWVLCSGSNVIYRLLYRCFVIVIVVVTVIPTKCLAIVGYSVTTVIAGVVVILIHHHQYSVMYLGKTLHCKPQGHRSIPDGVTELFQLTFV
jgi:hypothetical protein